jgi:hypothetical protein
MNLTVYQLKWLINEYNIIKDKDKPEITKYKTKKKDELLKIIHDFNINQSNFQIPQQPKRDPPQILKKYDKKPFNKEEQDEYLIDLNKNIRYQNPLISPNPSINLKPQEHQRNFIRQFIFSGLKGAIAYHGVGSGKTLTAVISSYYYLKLKPNNTVLIISPSALLYNFIEGMIQYGLNISDNRYTFLTYDQYLRKKTSGKDSLIIIDEAHNFRTPIITMPIMNDKNIIIGEQPLSNIKGYVLRENAMKLADKIILLTGTAFVNRLYDIENLLSWIDGRTPLDVSSFTSMLGSDASMIDHFNYRISYFQSPKDSNFPERRDFIVPFMLDEDSRNLYNTYKNEGVNNKSTGKPNSFYSSERAASTFLKTSDISLKNQYTIDLINNTKNQKFIIYVTLYDNGLVQLVNVLKKHNIYYTIISGKESKIQKEISKKYFNFYNFNNPLLFTNENTTPQDYMYINNKYRVLIITKAGSEGVDTKNCQNLIMMNGVWNQAASEQIIARAIRYKSHFGLNIKERYVNVYKYFICKDESEKEQLIKMTNDSNFNYIKLLSNVREELSLIRKEANGYGSIKIPTIQSLRNMGLINKTTYIKKRGGYGKKSIVVIDEEGFDLYIELYNNLVNYKLNNKNLLLKEKKELKDFEKKIIKNKPNMPSIIKLQELEDILKNWLFKTYKRLRMKSKIKNIDDDEDEKTVVDSSYTIDIYLFILSMAKEQNINEFIISLQDSTIKRFEEYNSIISNMIYEYSIKNQKTTEDELDKLELELFNKQNIQNVILKSASVNLTKQERQTFEKNQQYYTEPQTVKLLFENSNLKNENQETILNILEPTCGVGNILSVISKLLIENKIIAKYDMIEIDPKNRVKLQKLELQTSNFTLLEQGNFLLSYPNKNYDYIFMNPPFHLRKREVYTAREVYDVDFIIRAFSFLKINGELLAIIGTKYKRDKILENQLYELKKYSTFSEILLPKQSFSNSIKIDVMLLKIIKKSNEYDNVILNQVFYPQVKESGIRIAQNLEVLDLNDDDNDLKLPNKY